MHLNHMVINHTKYSFFNFYYASEDLVQTKYIGFSLECLGSNQNFFKFAETLR